MSTSNTPNDDNTVPRYSETDTNTQVTMHADDLVSTSMQHHIDTVLHFQLTMSNAASADETCQSECVRVYPKLNQSQKKAMDSVLKQAGTILAHWCLAICTNEMPAKTATCEQPTELRWGDAPSQT